MTIGFDSTNLFGFNFFDRSYLMNIKRRATILFKFQN